MHRPVLLLALGLYLLLFAGLTLAKPAFLYLPDGSLRDFGLDSSQKTIFPVWWVAVLGAALCYLLALRILPAAKSKYV